MDQELLNVISQDPFLRTLKFIRDWVSMPLFVLFGLAAAAVFLFLCALCYRKIANKCPTCDSRLTLLINRLVPTQGRVRHYEETRLIHCFRCHQEKILHVAAVDTIFDEEKTPDYDCGIHY